VFNTNELVVESEKIMLTHADRVVLLADHTKLGCRAMCKVCDLAEVDTLITDRAPDAAHRRAFKQAEVEVLTGA